MIEYTLYTHNQGCGYVATDPDEYRTLPGFRPESVQVGDEVLTPGVATDCSGFFCRKLLYLGLIEENGMLFLIGVLNPLFPECMYQLVHRIEQNRIYENFGDRHGRDFFYKDGRWK
ncbi:hypothetical protein [Rudanella lutea]|uniref:hypothetical protein n=1 Tax=Rudanella lutea TaxID=451374 RepID=UPI00037D5BBD|nr:hypothetical protein [Rudanella lutea]